MGLREKIDGWRILVLKEAGGVQLISRNGRDHTKRFHAIAEALAALKPKTLTLDGEVAVFDAELVSRFEWLRRPAPRLSSSQEVRIGLGARSRVHCSNSVGDTFPRELWGRTAL